MNKYILRGDLGWWSREAGARGECLSSPLRVTAFRWPCTPFVLLPLCLSGTLAFLRHHNCYFAQVTQVAARSAVAILASVAGDATHERSAGTR